MPAESIFYPSLDTGLVAQTPVQLSIQRYVPRTLFPDGSQLLSNLDNWRQYRWRLHYGHLSEAEQTRFNEFLQQIGRGALEFCFPDPLGNLLRYSESLNHSAWVRSPGLEVGPIEFIPGKTSWILTNPTAIPQRLEQLVDLAGNYALCFSLWAAWTSSQPFSLQAGAVGTETVKSFQASAVRRFALAVKTGSAVSAVRVGVDIPPNSQLILSSPQLEIGVEPQGYVKTGEQSGLFTQARLMEQPILGYATSANRRGLSIEVQGVQRI